MGASELWSDVAPSLIGFDQVVFALEDVIEFPSDLLDDELSSFLGDNFQDNFHLLLAWQLHLYLFGLELF